VSWAGAGAGVVVPGASGLDADCSLLRVTTQAPAGGLLVVMTLGTVLRFHLTAAPTGQVILHLDGGADHLVLTLGPPGKHQHHLHLPLHHLGGVARVGWQVTAPLAPRHGHRVRHHLDHLLHGHTQGAVGGKDEVAEVEHHWTRRALDHRVQDLLLLTN
jgi:hypothetical protein